LSALFDQIGDERSFPSGQGAPDAKVRRSGASIGRARRAFNRPLAPRNAAACLRNLGFDTSVFDFGLETSCCVPRFAHSVARKLAISCTTPCRSRVCEAWSACILGEGDFTFSNQLGFRRPAVGRL